MIRSHYRLAGACVAGLVLTAGLMATAHWSTAPARPTLSLVLGEAVSAQGPQAAPFKPGRPIAIVGGLLIDATDGPPRWDQTVVIEGERITQIGPMDQVKPPAGAEVIDATGMTIMPGLINSNQHIQLNPMYPAPTANIPVEQIRARWEANFARQPYRAWVYLMQGITSLRQTSGPWKRSLPIKQQIDNGEIPGPRIFLGGALFMSDEYFRDYTRNTPPDAVEWLRNEFAYHVITDVDKDTDSMLGPEFNYWKLYFTGQKWDGKNDFTPDEIRFMVDKAHKHGKIVDAHCGGGGLNDGLRRCLDFDIDTLEHPFGGGEVIDWDIIEGYKKQNVIVDTLLTVSISNGLRAADPHRFNESLYIMSFDPREYRILMQYRDTMLANQRNPNDPMRPVYDPLAPPDFPGVKGAGGGEGGGRGMSYAEQQRRIGVSKENMRRFIKAGVKFSMGTDTGSFLNFQQEDPNANEVAYFVELGMDPMDAIRASTRNGAEALGLLKDLGTIEKGKLADVIVVAGNPLQDMKALKRVAYVIKGGVRYK